MTDPSHSDQHEQENDPDTKEWTGYLQKRLLPVHDHLYDSTRVIGRSKGVESPVLNNPVDWFFLSIVTQF